MTPCLISTMRQGQLRKGATALNGIALVRRDITAMVAFLNSLNEDYE